MGEGGVGSGGEWMAPTLCRVAADGAVFDNWAFLKPLRDRGREGWEVEGAREGGMGHSGSLWRCHTGTL